MLNDFWIKIWTEWFSVSQPLAEEFASGFGRATAICLCGGLFTWCVGSVLKLRFGDTLPKRTKNGFFFSGLFQVVVGVLMTVIPALIFR